MQYRNSWINEVLYIEFLNQSINYSVSKKPIQCLLIEDEKLECLHTYGFGIGFQNLQISIDNRLVIANSGHQIFLFDLLTKKKMRLAYRLTYDLNFNCVLLRFFLN